MAVLASPKPSTDTPLSPPPPIVAAPEKTQSPATGSSKPQPKKDSPAAFQKSPITSQPKATAASTARSASDSSQHPRPKAASPQIVQPGTQKKVSRRSSKPIINWFQRKLASTGRARRASDSHGSRPPIPAFEQASQAKRERANTTERPKSIPGPITLNDDIPPVPQLVIQEGARRRSLRHESLRTAADEDADGPSGSSGSDTDTDDRESLPRSSLAPESMWSPSVAFERENREADEDASVRPLPPSAPPSPSPSHSSSSYLSHPYTFRSMAASTKPTTVLSIDVGNPAMAHIAEPPLTPLSQVARFPQHVRQGSLGASSVAFALPPAAAQQQPAPATAAAAAAAAPTAGTPADGNAGVPVLQAPLHTTHHPRYNPRPSSPPPDDASVLTLASSAFGVPGARIGANALSWGAAPSALELGADSGSQLDGAGTVLLHDGASAQFDDEREVSASMRALRSRRSWESEASRWSARIGPAGGTGTTSLGPGTPVGERSMWGGATSVQTGGYPSYADHGEGSASGREGSVPRPARDSPVPVILTSPLASAPSGTDTASNTASPTSATSAAATTTAASVTTPVARSAPENGEATPPALPGSSATPSTHKDYFPNMERGNSFASTRSDNQTDVFVSAPSTPMVTV